MRCVRRSVCAVTVLALLPCVYGAGSPGAANAQASTAPARNRRRRSQDTAAKPPVIHVQSNLVLADVVITKNGAPVKGLTADKFHVVENGKEQELTVFEDHMQDAQTAGNAAGAPRAKALDLGPNVYSDYTPDPPSSSINVLLLDALNTETKDQAYVRKEMLAYLRKVPPGTHMAVFTLASRLRMIQGFTADPSVLAKAITEKGDIVASRADTSKAAYEGMEEAVYNTVVGQGSGIDAAIDMQQFAADMKSFDTDVQEELTMTALRQIARYLGTIPGRKNLIWFSGSFPLNIDPVAVDSRITLKSNTTGETVMNNRNPRDNRTTRDYASDVQETDRLLTAARIAVYPVDAHGLLSMQSAYDASTETSTVLGLAAAPGQDPITSKINSSINPYDATQQMATAQMEAVGESHNRGQTLQQIAADTGGKAFVDTNGFQDAIKQALTDGANYYTIGYTPQGQDDGQYRRIKIRLDGGYDLAYRDGYYARRSRRHRGRGNRASTMKEATQFGAPPPSEDPVQGARALLERSGGEGLYTGARPGGRKRQKAEGAGDAVSDRLHRGRAPVYFREDCGRSAAYACGVRSAGLRCGRQGHQRQRPREWTSICLLRCMSR